MGQIPRLYSLIRETVRLNLDASEFTWRASPFGGAPFSWSRLLRIGSERRWRSTASSSVRRSRRTHRASPSDPMSSSDYYRSSGTIRTIRAGAIPGRRGRCSKPRSGKLSCNRHRAPRLSLLGRRRGITAQLESSSGTASSTGRIELSAACNVSNISTRWCGPSVILIQSRRRSGQWIRCVG
jgi:hypothetical protein